MVSPDCTSETQRQMLPRLAGSAVVSGSTGEASLVYPPLYLFTLSRSADAVDKAALPPSCVVETKFSNPHHLPNPSCHRGIWQIE